MINRRIDAMLFDFDGTIADTSQDMVSCLNILLNNHNLKEVELSHAKNYISKGAAGLIDFSCPKVSSLERSKLISDYLEIYKKNLFIKTHLFNGISEVIDTLVSKNIKWGIVTNKARYFAENIMKYHQLFDSCSVMMCGDDYGFKPKPSPELLIEACRLLDTNISDVIYIGDGHRDILSANSAKIKSVLACYGYLKKGDLIEEWQPNYIIHKPSEVVDLDIFSLNNSLS